MNHPSDPEPIVKLGTKFSHNKLASYSSVVHLGAFLITWSIGGYLEKS